MLKHCGHYTFSRCTRDNIHVNICEKYMISSIVINWANPCLPTKSVISGEILVVERWNNYNKESRLRLWNMVYEICIEISKKPTQFEQQLVELRLMLHVDDGGNYPNQYTTEPIMWNLWMEQLGSEITDSFEFSIAITCDFAVQLNKFHLWILYHL